MRTATTPTAPPAGEPDRRSVSGRAFVVASVLAAAGLVAFLVFVSPILLARTQAAAPPPAPQEIASGPSGGQRWTATAVERGPEEPCLAVEVASAETARACTGLRGPSLRAVESVEVGGSTLLYGIVDARTTLVRLDLGDAAALALEPAYVDFGFPLGFFAAALPADARLRGVEALDRDGEPRGSAPCVHGEAGPDCTAGGAG